MDKKMKLIAIILSIISLSAAMIAFSYMGRYNSLTRDFQELQKEKQTLRAENDALAAKYAKAEEETGALREAQRVLKEELGRLNSERLDLQNKHNLLQEERDKLTEKLQRSLSGAAALSTVSPTVSAAPGGADEYWAGLLKEKGNLELQLDNLRNILRNNQLKIDELGGEKLTFDLEIQKLNKEKTDLQRQLEYNAKLLDSISLELVREKEDKRQIQKQANLMKEENYALRIRLKEATNSNVSLEKKLKETEDRRLELHNRLNQMDRLLEDKISEAIEASHNLGELKKGLTSSSQSAVELSPIVVPSASPAVGGVNEAPSGRIVSINEEKGFVIFDRGQAQGIYPGQKLSVYQDAKKIAALEAIQVRPNVSAADIKEKTAQIKVGDVVK